MQEKVDPPSSCTVCFFIFRYCSSDAYFSVKEIDLAIVADLGTLQRLPLLVGYGNTMELALTGRKLSAQEAKSIGLVNDVFASKEALEENVTALARSIASKSPLAVVGTKRVLIKSRDLSVQNGLDYVATWNSAMLGSHDLKEAMEAWMQKRKASFSKL
jgi:delta(3,5)-delta(2,4)-dienoyl-CoA isomerase